MGIFGSHIGVNRNSRFRLGYYFDIEIVGLHFIEMVNAVNLLLQEMKSWISQKSRTHLSGSSMIGMFIAFGRKDL